MSSGINWMYIWTYHSKWCKACASVDWTRPATATKCCHWASWMVQHILLSLRPITKVEEPAVEVHHQYQLGGNEPLRVVLSWHQAIEKARKSTPSRHNAPSSSRGAS